MTNRRRSISPHALELAIPLLLAIALLSLAACAGRPLATPSNGRFDPVTQDIADFDSAHPPAIVETRFVVDGDRVNAILYLAQGAGPHPTALLLHGFPGNEKNLDLAQAMRRAGWNVVFFHYRGSWGSEGEFSFVRVLEDVAVVSASIREAGFASTHRIDRDRVALVGHSMGGFAALVSAGEIDEVSCVASLAGANIGGLAQAMDASAEAAERSQAQLDSWSGPIRSPGGAALLAEVSANRDRFDTTAHAKALARKPTLLVAGGLDGVTPVAIHHGPLVEALEVERADSLRTHVFQQGDHSFSGQRIELARILVDWLTKSCRSAQ